MSKKRETNTTESGLKYSVINLGDGAKPKVGDTVSMHYELYLGRGSTTSLYDYDNEEYIDEICDSTYDEKNPFSGPVSLVIGNETPKDETYRKGDSIKGLDEALLDMRVGGKRRLSIPSDLAYGDKGASSFHTFHGYRTPPNSGLEITIELVEIKE